MRLRNSPEGYGATAQALHWLTVALVLVAWVLGTFDDVLPKGSPRATGLYIHMAVGIAILAVLAVRLLWRLADPAPTIQTTSLGKRLDRVAQFTHFALYALLVAAPVAGIVLQFARGGALPLFGLTEIPSPWPADRVFARSVKEVHELLSNALVILAALHAVAALVHHWLLRDRTLVRMLPWSKP